MLLIGFDLSKKETEPCFAPDVPTDLPPKSTSVPDGVIFIASLASTCFESVGLTPKKVGLLIASVFVPIRPLIGAGAALKNPVDGLKGGPKRYLVSAGLSDDFCV